MKWYNLCLFLPLLLAGCGVSESGDPEEAQNELESEQVRYLAIVDSIGVELGDPDYVFGSIEAVSHTTEGNILVLDRAACSVAEFDPDGEFVRRMGRSGSGPGEFLNPLSMVRLGDGRVAVLDINLGGFFTFLPDGSYEGMMLELLGGEPIMYVTPSVENTFIGTLNTWNLVGDEYIVSVVVGRFGMGSGEPLTVYWQDSFPWDFQDITPLVKGSYFARTWASDRSGNVFVAPRSEEEYIIQGFSAEGEPTVTIELELDPVRKTDDEIAEEAYFWNRRAASMGVSGPIDYQPDEYRWMVHSMGIDADERLWVRRGTEETPTFDVFNIDGDYLFKAELEGVSASGGLFWEIKIDEFGILAYSLDPEDGYQKLYILELE